MSGFWNAFQYQPISSDRADQLAVLYFLQHTGDFSDLFELCSTVEMLCEPLILQQLHHLPKLQRQSSI